VRLGVRYRYLLGADHVEFIIGREERGRVVGTSGLEKLGLWHFAHQ
jgi:hypothetical protein